jgi:hypothetical protein
MTARVASSMNIAWRHRFSAPQVGAAGIVRFFPGLAPTWHYPRYTEAGPWDVISDCYALDVDDTCAWACYDSDFPVVCIREGAVTGWHNDIKGASALAVAGFPCRVVRRLRPRSRPACPDRARRQSCPARWPVPARRSPATKAACISSPEPAGTSSTWTTSWHDRAQAKLGHRASSRLWVSGFAPGVRRTEVSKALAMGAAAGPAGSGTIGRFTDAAFRGTTGDSR